MQCGHILDVNCERKLSNTMHRTAGLRSFSLRMAPRCRGSAGAALRSLSFPLCLLSTAGPVLAGSAHSALPSRIPALKCTNVILKKNPVLPTLIMTCHGPAMSLVAQMLNLLAHGLTAWWHNVPQFPSEETAVKG